MLKYSSTAIPYFKSNLAFDALPEDIAEDILLNKSCHVDHEGFDLNEIEQEYYKHNGIVLKHDPTWYKDGGQETGANAIIYDWIAQDPDSALIIDHSQVVVKYPIRGNAAYQILKYAEQRPELARLVSTEFKCGLDLCIDYIDKKNWVVEPIVHIEWDFEFVSELHESIEYVEKVLKEVKWNKIVPVILEYNKKSKRRKVDAFAQADTRSQLLFGEKSYKLIPTL
jgi:hypothetical protein